MFAARHHAFEQMVRTYTADLYQFAYWLCRDRSVAEDIVQETFARAWKSWKDLRDEHTVKFWLFTVLRREHARLYERRRLPLDPRPVEDIDIAVESNTHAALEMDEMLIMLPVAYREPLLLQVLGGFSCAEIAQLLSISEASVMTRVSRARKMLRGFIESSDVVREVYS